jgi:hypothetical protein
MAAQKETGRCSGEEKEEGDRDCPADEQGVCMRCSPDMGAARSVHLATTVDAVATPPVVGESGATKWGRNTGLWDSAPRRRYGWTVIPLRML